MIDLSVDGAWALLSNATIAKVERTARAGTAAVPDSDVPGIWWVRGSSGLVDYRLQSDYDPATDRLSWLTCTCAFGMNQGGRLSRCYHAGLVLRSLR